MNDDTRTFAVFHPSEAQTPGLSWFLFPAHGVGIQISGVVVVLWEGNMLEHCACSVVEGVLGECLKSEKQSTRYAAIQKAFNEKKHNNKLRTTMIVVVRETLAKLNERGAGLCMLKNCDAKTKSMGKVSYRHAVIEGILHDNAMKIVTKDH